MSEQYTPTTEEVREWYGHKNGCTHYKSLLTKSLSEFDRWLAQVEAKVWNEGFDKGTAHGIAYQAGNDEAWKRPPNPYRIESQETP